MKNLACGVGTLIGYGIEQFIRERGYKPVAVLLHPAHADAVASEPEWEPGLLDSVSVIVSSRVSSPALLDRQGNTHRL